MPLTKSRPALVSLLCHCLFLFHVLISSYISVFFASQLAVLLFFVILDEALHFPHHRFRNPSSTSSEDCIPLHHTFFCLYLLHPRQPVLCDLPFTFTTPINLFTFLGLFWLNPTKNSPSSTYHCWYTAERFSSPICTGYATSREPFSISTVISENTWIILANVLHSPSLLLHQSSSSPTFHIRSVCTLYYIPHKFICFIADHSGNLSIPSTSFAAPLLHHSCDTPLPCIPLYCISSNFSFEIRFSQSSASVHAVLTLDSPSLAALGPWTHSSRSLPSALRQAALSHSFHPFTTQSYIYSSFYSIISPPSNSQIPCPFPAYRVWDRLPLHFPEFWYARRPFTATWPSPCTSLPPRKEDTGHFFF